MKNHCLLRKSFSTIGIIISVLVLLLTGIPGTAVAGTAGDGDNLSKEFETAAEDPGNQWLPALIGLTFIIPLAVCFFVVTRKTKKKPTGYLEKISKQAIRIFSIMSDIDAVSAGTNLTVIDIAITTVKERETNTNIALAAEKLRKLSEQTAAITAKIADTNTAVRQSLEKMLFAIRKEDGTKTDGYAVRVEENLAELEKIRRQVTQVLTEITIMSRGCKEIMNGMTMIKNTKQESRAREATSRTILAGIQEMHDRAETIREITEYLAKMSDKMND